MRCRRWGTFCARHAILVVCIPLVVSVGLSACVPLVEVTTNPVELWCPPDSEVRHQKDYYDHNFECACCSFVLLRSVYKTIGAVKQSRSHTQLPTLPMSRSAQPPPLAWRDCVTGAPCCCCRLMTRSRALAPHSCDAHVRLKPFLKVSRLVTSRAALVTITCSRTLLCSFSVLSRKHYVNQTHVIHSYCYRLWCSPFLRNEQIIVRHKTGGYWLHANTGSSTGYTAYPLVYELSFLDDLFTLQARPRSTSESTSNLLQGSLDTCVHVFIVCCSLARRHV